MPKIVVLDGYTENPGDLSWDGLAALGEVVVYPRTKETDIVARIGDADIVFTNKTPLTKETLAACPKVQYIGVLATGYNVVDVQAAKEQGIVVTNIPEYGTDAVAQFTFALLLECCHHVGHHARRVAEGYWQAQEDFCFWDYPLIELAGKTMGFIGFGRIGQTAARIAQAFGLKVLAYDKHPNPSGEQLAQYVDLDTLLRESDVVSLHCPLFEDTKGLINQETLGKMKPGAILLNTSRGPLVVEADVRRALDAGSLAAYGADVVSVEPILPDNPLLGAKNCLLTPHIAWAPKESRKRLMDVAVSNLAGFLQGSPVNVVNP